MNAANNKSARKGKIARLPYEIREAVNEMMRDGARVSRLNTFLIESGYEACNDTNWTNWRQGGYQDWLQEQKRLDEIKNRSESIRRELEAGGFSVLDKAIYDVANDLSNPDLDPIKVAGAVAALKSVVTGSKRAETYERRAKLAEEALELQKQKFERETCKLFLKWRDNDRAKEIADGKSNNKVKIDQLRELIFGRRPDDAASD